MDICTGEMIKGKKIKRKADFKEFLSGSFENIFEGCWASWKLHYHHHVAEPYNHSDFFFWILLS